VELKENILLFLFIPEEQLFGLSLFHLYYLEVLSSTNHHYFGSSLKPTPTESFFVQRQIYKEKKEQ